MFNVYNEVFCLDDLYLRQMNYWTFLSKYGIFEGFCNFEHLKEYLPKIWNNEEYQQKFDEYIL